MIPWRKIWTNAVLDWQLASARLPSGGSRVGRLAAKYSAIARDAREVRIGGATLRYDNRFTPALMGSYLHDARRLDRLVSLSSLRTMIDIGANVGQLAFALKLHRPELAIWSFEPNPEAFSLLSANAADWSGWTAVPSGVGTKGTVTLHFVRGKSGQGSVHLHNAIANLDARGLASLEVPIAPLDGERARALSIPRLVDLLKIDVEGAELDTLEHAGGVRPRYVLMELSVGRAGSQPPAVFEGVMRRHWRVDPVVLWRSPASESHGTQDWLWQIG